MATSTVPRRRVLASLDQGVPPFITGTAEMEHGKEEFVVNEIVLLLDGKTPRSSWPLGRVIEVYTNRRDGLVRSVKRKTRTTELIRPVNKITLLEGAEATKNDK